MKRLFLSVFLSFCFIVLLSPPALAAECPWVLGCGYDDALQEGFAGGSNAESFRLFNVGGFFDDYNVLLMGVSSDTIKKISMGEIGPEDKAFYEQLQGRSLAGGVSRGIAMIYSNPPASLGPWIADVGQTLGFIPKQVYAQGIGFSGLSALLPVWKAFRNIAYLILAVVMIVIGFMVMLRKKIDPKTVVTVQNALPRIVITLILITFSYAIVGFLIDLMYLLILLAVAVVGSTMKNSDATQLAQLQATFTAGGFLESIKYTFGSLAELTVPGLSGIGTAGAAALAGSSAIALIPGIGWIAAVIIALVTGLFVGGFSGTGVGLGFLSPILLLLLWLSLIVTIVRILLIVVNAYIQIIISLLFGPLQIMLEAIPGSNGFASWLNNLIVHLLTFPIVATLIIIGGSIGSNISNQFWQPPLVPKTAFGAAGSSGSQFIQALLGVGIIMSIPSIIHAVKEALKIKPAVPTGAGVLTQPLFGAIGGALSFGTQFYYVGSIPRMIDDWRKGRTTVKPPPAEK